MPHLRRRARTTTTTTGALVAVVLTSLALAAGPASADDDDDEVIREGACSSGTDWKVKAKTDDGRIELEGEVDSNQNGQTWTWGIRAGRCAPAE